MWKKNVTCPEKSPYELCQSSDGHAWVKGGRRLHSRRGRGEPARRDSGSNPAGRRTDGGCCRGGPPGLPPGVGPRKRVPLGDGALYCPRVRGRGHAELLLDQIPLPRGASSTFASPRRTLVDTVPLCQPVWLVTYPPAIT